MRANKSEKRTKLLNDIIEAMVSHEIFSDNVKRKDDEATIQKALFLRLEKGKALQKILTENNVTTSTEKADAIALKKFAYEHDINTTVNQFSSFGTQHRPDAVLDLGDIRIAIEIKKGDNGSAIRAGLGQSLLYSHEYSFVVFFFVDTTPGLNIKNSITGEKEQEIINDLWNNHNVRFIVV
jgi:hypothetical protein